MSRASKFLSLILRHEPHRVGVTLDANGWTSVDGLLAGLAANGVPLTRDELFAIVRDSDKQRFALSDDRTRIRANQGHSVQIELDLPDAIPPARLYHGTYEDAIASIHATGLSKGKRHAVHLAAETTTATKVGMRKGAPVILTIRADEMVAEGIKFQQSANGVWLTERVPARFIDFPSEADRPEWRHWAGSDAKPRTQIAAETERAVDAGSYTAPSGALVSIAATTELARRRTVMYEPSARFKPPAKRHATTFAVVAESTNQAIYRLAAKPGAGHVCAMNFASAKHPGGGWRGGARAQEESMARASALVTCLETQPSYYARNRAMRSALYLDLVLFSPLVPFFRDDDGAWLEKPVLASVVTVAAPNATALRQHGELRPAKTRPAKSTSSTSIEHAVADDSSAESSGELDAIDHHSAPDEIGPEARDETDAAIVDELSAGSSGELEAADELSAGSSGELAAIDDAAGSSGTFEATDELDTGAPDELDAGALDEFDAESGDELDAAIVGELAASDDSAESSGAIGATNDAAGSSGTFEVTDDAAGSSGTFEATGDAAGSSGTFAATHDAAGSSGTFEATDDAAGSSASAPGKRAPLATDPSTSTSGTTANTSAPFSLRVSRGTRRSRISNRELEATLRRRARLALDACVHHRVDRLILGAWGAGVFGNDPDLIADCFAEPLFGNLAGAFVEVVFAILGGPGAANYDAFAKRFPSRLR